MQSGLSRQLSVEDIGVPVLRSNNIVNGHIDLTDIKYWYLKDTKGATTENYFLKKNDLLVNFINSIGKMGKSSVYNNELKRPAIFTTNLMRLNFKDNINTYFIYYFFNTSYYKNYIDKITKPAVNQASFTTKDFKKMEIPIPNLHEQEKIAYFLKTIDKKIDLLKNKYEKYADFKKYLMQQIFAQKLRFASFNDDWKTVKIKDIFDERSEKGFVDLELLSVTLREGVIKRSEIEAKDNSNENKTNYKHVMPEDIVYNSMRMWQGASGVSPYEGIVSPAYTILIPKKVYSKFFGFYFKTAEMIHQFKKYSQGLTSDTWNLKYPLISEIKIKIPSIEEQKEITKIFETIDMKLEIIQNNLEEMAIFKKGLLQQMFV